MSLSERLEKELIEFARQLVRLQSYSDNEGAVAEAVVAKMRELGYDEAFIDSTGNAVGFIGGPLAIGGSLLGNIVSGLLIALFMSNAGGLWDNAKKYIESGAEGGKGSKAHKAAVIGDTVGDPFKDTAGPSINTQITVVSLVSSLMSSLFVWFSVFH